MHRSETRSTEENEAGNELRSSNLGNAIAELVTSRNLYQSYRRTDARYVNSIVPEILSASTKDIVRA